MDALFYLFKYQMMLLMVIIISILAVLVVPRRFFKRKWGWLLILIEIITLVVISYLHIQPQSYPRNYINHYNIKSDLGEIAKSRGLRIGVAVSNNSEILKPASVYFNSLTVENDLKWGKLVGSDLNSYDFSKADSIVEFATEKGLNVRGHVLVWGRAVDFFKSPNLREILKDVSDDQMKDTLLYFIKNNIETVLGRYKGKIKSWDCVNEPLEVFSGKYHENIFYEYLGKDYIAQSFEWAHEVDPDVELFLNEQFDQYNSEKAEAFLSLVEGLVKEGVPIHGVGIQAHAMFTIPELEPLKIFIRRISALGLKIEFTELDARLRLFHDRSDPYEAQGKFIADICSVCLEEPNCSGITLWGLSDNYDWYNNMGVFKLHQPNASTLFDENMIAKPAYHQLYEKVASWSENGHSVRNDVSQE